ncbi:hypothetical protein LPJ64_000721 [Coemansia asiatica]|uniref:Uncharacterized protein n=1 Tax=Coemansia asiatica TaxID=1052880 RepID=A0A9W7XRD8_9FUNG|nr:hypothetical protein LPJ64_000721 [Coemansia asiatica]
MFALRTTKRLSFLSTTIIIIRSKSTGRFLEPQVSPLGSFAKPITKSAQKELGEKEEQFPRATTLWSLAERRALFLFSRAISVAYEIDPNWTTIGQQLQRDPLHCRFINRFITNQWLEHNSKRNKKNNNAGLSISKLGKLKDGDEKIKQEIEEKWDKETLQWLQKLAEVMEIPNTFETKKFERWTFEEFETLKDHCVLFRYPTREDLEECLRSIGKNYTKAIYKLYASKTRYRGRLTGPCRPLSQEELGIIDEAVKDRAPDMVRWMDVKDKLKDRSFEETIDLLRPSKPRPSGIKKEGEGEMKKKTSKVN